MFSAGISSLRVQVKFQHGPFSRTRPHPPRSRRPLRLYRRSALLRRKTSVAPRPPPRRHRLPRRTHHLLLPDCHLPPSQPRSFSPLLAFWAVPQVTMAFPLLPLLSSSPLPHFLHAELRANKRFDPLLSCQP